MTQSLDIFKELETHAREWLDFSRDAYGWQSRTFGDKVWCYFAENSNHRAVRLGEHDCEVEIQFHSPVKFGGMTYSALESLDAILADCRALLVSERLKASQRTEAEVVTERSKQIETLRMRLAELEGGVAA